MPTYVYECKECRHRFEIFQSFKAEALDTCPECGAVALRKVLFPAGVVFKGSGFYVNDSRGPRPKAATGRESKPDQNGKKDRMDKGEDSTSSKDSTSKKEPATSGAGKES